MIKTTITIEKSKVLHIVEGLSGTISQHNAGVPTFEQLWASPSDSKKLDIWLRDALLDLEESLMKWMQSTHEQYTLTADEGDLSIELQLNDHWSEKLTGLLANRLQYYFVHAVLAGWLGDLDGVKAPDYRELATTDLKGIMNVLLYRELVVTEEDRHQDTESKDTGGGVGDSGDRHEDGDQKHPVDMDADNKDRSKDSEGKDAGAGDADIDERHEDIKHKDTEGVGSDSDERHEDFEHKDTEGVGSDSDERHEDFEYKDVQDIDADSKYRSKNDEGKADRSDKPEAASRDKDDAKGCCCAQNRLRGVSRDKDDLRRLNRREDCWTDWSGMGVMH